MTARRLPIACGLAALAIGAAPGQGAAQAPRYSLQQLDSAQFAETVHSKIVSQAGTAERHRTVQRMAQYSFTLRGDTLVATSDTVQLSEDAEGVVTDVDVDAVIGARWALQLDPHGAATVFDAPVVPRSIADVSDISTAMDDFFPALPLPLAVGARAADSSGRVWNRLADSAGVQRYHYAAKRDDMHRISSSDSVRVESAEVATETADVAWDARRGPVAWSRHIQTTVTSHFSGRTVRADVDQQIAVRRIR
jgi:hypothetical protein